MTARVKEVQDVRVIGALRTRIPYVKVGLRCGRCQKRVITFTISNTAIDRRLPGAMGIGVKGHADNLVWLDVDRLKLKCRGCPGIWCLADFEVRDIVRTAAAAGDRWVTIPY
jgi:hypothetical protein